jgi:Kef-type K+ transport system membrane component KefB
LLVRALSFPVNIYINIRKKRKNIFLVGIGCVVALWFYNLNTGITTSKAAFILFIGKIRNDKSYEWEKKYLFKIASGFGFAAFPVLATLLNSTGLLNKPIGIQIVSIAAVEDICVWVILAIASAFANGGTPLQGLYTLLLTLAFIVIMVFIIRPILKWIHAYYYRRSDGTNVYVVVICFLILLAAAFTTEVMGKKFCKKINFYSVNFC